MRCASQADFQRPGFAHCFSDDGGASSQFHESLLYVGALQDLPRWLVLLLWRDRSLELHKFSAAMWQPGNKMSHILGAVRPNFLAFPVPLTDLPCAEVGRAVSASSSTMPVVFALEMVPLISAAVSFDAYSFTVLHTLKPVALVCTTVAVPVCASAVSFTLVVATLVNVTVCICRPAMTPLQIIHPLAVVSTSVPVPVPVAPHTSADTMPLPPSPLALVPAV